MAEHVRIEHVSLQKAGATLSMSIEGGQLVCVVGPGASGKSRLLAVIGRDEKPARGTVMVSERLSFAGRPELSRRSRPQELARAATSNDANASAEVLSALRLWDCRNSPISQLSDSQEAAAELIHCLSATSGCAVIDGHLDRLDPWSYRSSQALIRQRLAEGVSFVVSTNRPDVAESADLIVVLRENAIRFAGTISQLLSAAGQAELIVETANPRAVRSLTEPFKVSIREESGTLTISTSEQQELAAKLVLEGYGDVSTVVVRQRTINEALLGLLP